MLRPGRRTPALLRALSLATATGLVLVAVGLATGHLAPDAPRHLRLTVAAVVVLLAVYRLVQTRACRSGRP